jgi:hypothetical protein
LANSAGRGNPFFYAVIRLINKSFAFGGETPDERRGVWVFILFFIDAFWFGEG